MWKCESVIVWEFERVRVWKCENVRVWKNECESLTVWKLTTLAVWSLLGPSPQLKTITHALTVPFSARLALLAVQGWHCLQCKAATAGSARLALNNISAESTLIQVYLHKTLLWIFLHEMKDHLVTGVPRKGDIFTSALTRTVSKTKKRTSKNPGQ